MENGIFFLGGKEKDLGLLLPGFVFQTPRIKKWQSFLKFQPKHFQGEHSASRRRRIVKFFRNPAVMSQNATGGRISAWGATLALETNSHLSPNAHVV